MRHALLTATALAALAAAPAASASVIQAGACVPSPFGTPCVAAAIAGPTAPPLLSVPATPVGNFIISGSAIAGVSATGATFNTQTIQVSTTGAGGLLDIYFTISDVPTQQVPLSFVSTFTSNQQNAVTHSVIESTWLDNANGLFDAGLATQLGTATLNNPLLDVAGPLSFVTTPGANISLTHLYEVELLGCGTQPNGICTANLTIDLSAQPVPEVGSLALLGVGLLGLLAVRRRAGSPAIP